MHGLIHKIKHTLSTSRPGAPNPALLPPKKEAICNQNVCDPEQITMEQVFFELVIMMPFVSRMSNLYKLYILTYSSVSHPSFSSSSSGLTHYIPLYTVSTQRNTTQLLRRSNAQHRHQLSWYLLLLLLLRHRHRRSLLLLLLLLCCRHCRPRL